MPKSTPTQVEGKSLTQQHFKDEVNINSIVQRSMKTGILGNPAATRQPIFGDFSSLDYMSMRNSIADIDQAFASLPAKIRARFKNDPHQVVRFVENPDNYKEALRLGLIVEPSHLDDDIEALRAEQDKIEAPFERDANGRPLPMSPEMAAKKAAQKEAENTASNKPRGNGLPNGDQ